MEKDEEKVCFELTNMGEKILIHINGNGEQIIEILFYALKESKDARALILAAVSKFLAYSVMTKTLGLSASIKEAEKRHVN